LADKSGQEKNPAPAKRKKKKRS